MANPPDSNQSPLPDKAPDIKQDVKGDRNQTVGKAINSNVVNAGDNATIHLPPLPSNELDTSKHIPNNLPRSGAIAFVGRDDLLKTLHNQLQNNERIGITGVRGMGGIGKTELALQYAIENLQIYPGGVCWLPARDQEIATQIVSFAKANLGIKPPDELEADEQVRFTWQRWPQGDSLIILDDVTDYQAIAPYLPPSDPRFNVLITTRINLGSSVLQIEIEELNDENAIALLKSIVGDERIESQLSDAKKLCEWVGNLPLGLELLGRFLTRKPDWAIAKLLKRLESKRLTAKALLGGESGMTAPLGVTAALELSWAELNDEEKDLACLLSMFAVDPIPWPLIEQCFEEIDPDVIEEWRDDGLRDRSLVRRVREGEYQLHQIVQEFFRENLKEKGDDALALKQAFGRVMVKQAQILDETPTLEQIEAVRGAIAHLEETVKQWLETLSDDNKIWPFVGLGRYYEGQGNYSLAELWLQKSYDDLKTLLGAEHPNVTNSLNNLALLYKSQGRYDKAEPLFMEALAIRRRVLGARPLDIATSLNNLAALYEAQGHHAQAEPLYEEAFVLTTQVLGTDHPDVATGLNNLALLYKSQGRYSEAEPLYLRALTIRKRMLRADHPDIATSLNNLASLYSSQGYHNEAEPLLVEALAIRKRTLGEKHPDMAASLNNLALLYKSQNRYKEAEPLYLGALEIWKQSLGEEHPNVATCLNNLALLYDFQGRYGEAESFYLEALALRKRGLGEVHYDVANSLYNLASFYDSQGRHSEAEVPYLNALNILRASVGEEHPHTQLTLSKFIECVSHAYYANQIEDLSDNPLTNHLINQLRSQTDAS